MVKYSLEDVTSDMILGESIFLPSGELLLAAGFHITEQYKKRLNQLGFHTVYIQVEGTEDVKAEEIISEHIKREVRSNVQNNAEEIKKTIDIRRAGIHDIRRLIRRNKKKLNRYLTNSGFIRSVESLIDQILNQPSVILNMRALRNSSSELFSHAINVTVTALCIGRKYHFSYEEMKQLAMGAINFDLGLVAVPEEIIKKQKPLTDEETKLYRQHTVYGYLMLSQNPAIASTSATIALQHHEYQNGTGFPRAMKGENRPPIKDFSRKGVIHRFSEIVAVADVYDMLTSGRIYYEEMPVKEALKKMIQMAGEKLNSEIIKTLTSIVPLFPVGSRIKVVNAPTPQLNDYYGVIAKDNPNDLEKPQIVLYETRTHKKIKPILIDMSQHTGFRLELIT